MADTFLDMAPDSPGPVLSGTHSNAWTLTLKILLRQYGPKFISSEMQATALT